MVSKLGGIYVILALHKIANRISRLLFLLQLEICDEQLDAACKGRVKRTSRLPSRCEGCLCVLDNCHFVVI